MLTSSVVLTFVLCSFALFNEFELKEVESKEDFLLITVATNETDGFKRFLRSTKVHEIPVKVLGLGQGWKGGDMKKPGGSYKVNLLKEELETYKDEDHKKLIMFTDSYDVLISGSVKDIIYRFKELDAGILFAAEMYCWPDEKLADQYPVTESKYKYLNSGGFIGYASDIYSLISTMSVSNKFDDQLFYTNLFLQPEIREKYRIKLDYKASIFQNLQGALEDVELRFDNSFSYLENTKYGTVPIVIHGNGLTKDSLSTVGNYVAGSWTAADGCLACAENKIQLPEDENDYPSVLLAVYITQPTPFLEEFFKKLENLDYPNKKIHLFIYNSVPYHSAAVSQFTDVSFKTFASLKQILPSDNIAEVDARFLAVKQCEKKKCDYLFSVDSIAHLDNRKTLKNLIEQNRGVIAPMVVRPYKAWSNFWGALTKDGYYQRSFDYMSIVNSERRGVWNVPYLSIVYLLNATLFKTAVPKYNWDNLDPDMAFCSNYREKGIFMYVDNTVEYGHLLDPDSFDVTRKHPDMYELMTNRYDWEQRYIHPSYFENLNPNTTVLQPCPDVYWFPIATPQFCKQLVEIVENFGQWSNGTNKDDRLLGGYENVPTRDIHMNQVGYEPVWLEFLQQYVRPVQERIFTGYVHDPPHSLMNFVVRYRPDEQPLLRPHHDSSTYTINLALNRPKIDYEGGGCKFLRYNCSVTDTKMGWMLMHPGRLTHFHEGLLVTKGTRYIMISFVDP